MRHLVLSRWLTLLLLATVPVTAAAQGPRSASQEGKARPPRLADLARIAARLHSKDPDEVREAIDLLSVIDHPRIVPYLADLLRSGQPDPITDRALEALGGLAHPSAIEVLEAFSRHRRVGARLRAYRALAAIEDERVVPLVERGLRDPDRTVRAAAAVALGEMGARRSLDVLFRAFDAGVVEAAEAIGKLGDTKAIERFHQYLGRRPLAVMLSGYEGFLLRRDVPIDAKKDIVNRLGEVSGPMVRSFLERILDRLPPTRPRKPGEALRALVRTTIHRIPPAHANQGGGAR